MPDSLTIALPGWDTFTTTMDAAAREKLTDLQETDRAAAELIATGARTRAPRMSGRLDASIRVSAVGPLGGGQSSGATFSDLIYAPVQEFGWPRHRIVGQHYFEDSATASEPAIGQLYITAITAIMDGVHGE